MASPNEPWTLAGGKKNKSQNSHAVSKGKKKAVVENMPRIEPNRKLFNNMLTTALSCPLELWLFRPFAVSFPAKGY